MKTKSMTELQTELDQIIIWFTSEDADIDKAEQHYARGLEIAAELEKRLKETKNTITKLKQNFEA